MNKPNRKSNKKKSVALAVIGIVLIGAVVVIWARHNRAATLNTDIATHSSAADNNANNSRKESSSPSSTLNNGSTTNNTSTPSSTGSGSSTATNSSDETITVTRAGVVASNLQVGTLVNDGTSGTCTVNVSQTGQTTISTSNQVTLENNSYVCPVFSLPLSKFPNLGDWNVSVTLSSGSNSTTSSWANNPVDLSGTP